MPPAASTSAPASRPRPTPTRSPRSDPTARFVYVDNDPLVLVHARASAGR
ncbi:SAM-dependent methyltransferase [Actinoplanes sp. NPDC051411]